MHTKVETDGPFSGRIFTANNFEKCSKSNSDTSLEQINITIPLDVNECGTVAAVSRILFSYLSFFESLQSDNSQIVNSLKMIYNFKKIFKLLLKGH